MRKEKIIREVIEAYKRFKPYVYDENKISLTVTSEFFEALEEALGALEDREWIPVTKGLPKENAHVIVSVMDEGKSFVTTDDYFCYGFDDWKDDVVAWMKTPKPYKGGDS